MVYLNKKLCKFCVITIHKGDLKFLKKTIDSIDNQNLLPIRHIIVAKNINNFQIQPYKKDFRIFFLNNKHDRSIYEAMNLAKKKTGNFPIFFLNSGDIFLKRNSLYQMSRFLYFLSLNYVVVFQTLLRIKNLYFEIKKNIFKNKNYLPHSSFISQNDFFNKKIYFNKKFKISADGLWMKDIIKRSRMVKKIPKNIVIQNLYGKSSLPSFQTFKWKCREKLASGVKEFFKLIISKLIPLKIYFLIIYYRKYNFFKN